MTPLIVVEMLTSYGPPREPDIFKIDIEAYDIFVVEALLRDGTLKPRLILMEINMKIPPPIQFTVNQNAAWGWRGDHCFGASIENIAQVVQPLGYVPIALDWNILYIMPRHAARPPRSTRSATHSARGAQPAFNGIRMWMCGSHSPPWRRFAGFSYT